MTRGRFITCFLTHVMKRPLIIITPSFFKLISRHSSGFSSSKKPDEISNCQKIVFSYHNINNVGGLICPADFICITPHFHPHQLQFF
jgi:hypothetical protein